MNQTRRHLPIPALVLALILGFAAPLAVADDGDAGTFWSQPSVWTVDELRTIPYPDPSG